MFDLMMMFGSLCVSCFFLFNANLLEIVLIVTLAMEDLCRNECLLFFYLVLILFDYVRLDDDVWKFVCLLFFSFQCKFVGNEGTCVLMLLFLVTIDRRAEIFLYLKCFTDQVDHKCQYKTIFFLYKPVFGNFQILFRRI